MLTRVIIALSIILFSSMCFAQEYENKVELTYKGKDGVWFDTATVDKMLMDLIEHKAWKDQLVPNLKLEITHQKELYNLALLEIDASDELSKRWEESYKEAEQLRIKEVDILQTKLDRKDAWYKSPAFTFILGTIGGGVLAVGIAYAVDR
jgi:hypothetical protein